MIQEPSTVGLSSRAKAALEDLEQAGVFRRLLDAYRFAVALGVSHGGLDRSKYPRGTIFNVGTLDPDRTLYEAVATVRDETDEPVYRTLERYAEWGAIELGRLHSGGEIELGPVLKEAEEAVD